MRPTLRAPAFCAIVSLVGLAACSSAGHEDGASGGTSEEAATARQNPYEGSCTPDGVSCAYFSPSDMPINAIADAFRSARRSIRIGTYNIDVPWLGDLLRRRLDDGVKVELLLDFKHAVGQSDPDEDGESVWSRLGEHPNLTKFAIPVLRGGNPQMHNKIIVIDDERVMFGSANWTYTGLVGNFENVFSTKDPTLLSKFVAEMDELRALSKAACDHFGAPREACGTGNISYVDHFKKLALDGGFKAVSEGAGGLVDATKPGCANLTTAARGSLLIPGNQPRIADREQLKACFADATLGEKYVAFVDEVAQIERYADGTPVSSDPPVVETVTPASGQSFQSVQFRHRDNQQGGTRAYFSGEDNLEYVLTRELKALETTPAESFAYVSTNFITNSRLARSLATLKSRGVRVRAFFDRGRFLDANFHSQFATLGNIGFSYGIGSQQITVRPGDRLPDGRQAFEVVTIPDRETEESLESKAVSIFNNDLSGAYGANHNKFAVIGKPAGDGRYVVTVLNGSANWSAMAMQQNDENLTVLEDDKVGAMYLREVLSQMFVYRYAQRDDSTGYQADYEFAARRVPCLRAVMGEPTGACTAPNGQPWAPAVASPVVVAVKDVPALPDSGVRVWAWVSNWRNADGTVKPRAFELFSGSTFAGKWVMSIPAPLGANLKLKFFKTPASVDPNRDGLGAANWEYSGVGNDREFRANTKPVMALRDSNLTWGRR